MTAEHYIQSKRLYVLTDDKGRLQPEIVNSSVNDPLSRFIYLESKRLAFHISDLKGKLHLEKEKVSGPRSQREKGDVRKSLEHEINHDQAILDVLEGKTVQPLVLKKEKGEIVSCNLGSFTSEDEAEFWKFAQANASDIMSVAKAFPKGIDWLRQGFGLRFLVTYGSTSEERSSAKKKYDKEFSRRYGDEVSDDEADILAPLMIKIAKMFPI